MYFDYEIRKLDLSFFGAYPNPPFTEIERNFERPHTMLVFNFHEDLFICVPFRSHIPHNNCYHFTLSNRSNRSKSGMDFSKTLIIKNPQFIGVPTTVDNDEFSEFLKNKDIIMEELIKYIHDYKNHCLRTRTLHQREYDRRYKYTTLKYFHDLLNI